MTFNSTEINNQNCTKKLFLPRIFVIDGARRGALSKLSIFAGNRMNQSRACSLFFAKTIKTRVSGFPRALLSLSHAQKRRALGSRLFSTYHMTRTVPRALLLRNYWENARKRAVREKMLIDWVRSDRKGKYFALGPCAVTSGQIISRPALPLSQLHNLLVRARESTWNGRWFSTDRFGSEILMLEAKGQVLYCVCAQFTVPGLILDLNTLLTGKLPVFVSLQWNEGC